MPQSAFPSSSGNRAILSLPKDDGDPPRLVGREHFGLPRLRLLVGAPGRREAAGCVRHGGSLEACRTELRSFGSGLDIQQHQMFN
jgi:hypothetical protein